MTFRDFVDPSRWSIDPEDLDLFTRRLGDFVPPDAFDAHAHWYDLRHLIHDDIRTDADADADADPIREPEVGHAAMVASMRRWMGDRVMTRGLYFGFPARNVDCRAANRLIADQVHSNAGCAGLMLIRPDDDPAEVEKTLNDEGRRSPFTTTGWKNWIESSPSTVVSWQRL